MKLKSIISFVLFINITTIFVLCGCATVIKCYTGPDRAKSDLAVVKCNKDIIVKTIDGTTIEDYRPFYYKGALCTGFEFHILPGQHSMGLDYNSNWFYSISTVSVDFSASADHIYKIIPHAYFRSWSPTIADITYKPYEDEYSQPTEDDTCEYCISSSIDRFFLRINYVNHSIGGEFDGQSFLYTKEEIFLIPKIRNASGFEIATSFVSNKGKIQLGYVRSKHEISFLNAEGEALFHMFSVDFYYNLLTKRLVKPYVLLGGGFTWLDVKDGSATIETNPKVSNAVFSGGGFNIGAGLEFFLSRNLLIDADVVFRRIGYSHVNGAKDKSVELEELLNGSGTSFNVGVLYSF
jgi:opacity protein-like surface antigen